MENLNEEILAKIEEASFYEYGQNSEIFNISPSYSVIFTEVHFSGMVGESKTSINASLVKSHFSGDIDETISLDYEDVCELYKFVSGKSERIDFWKWKEAMSPEAVAERGHQENMQALSIVK